MPEVPSILSLPPEPSPQLPYCHCYCYYDYEDDCDDDENDFPTPLNSYKLQPAVLLSNADPKETLEAEYGPESNRIRT